ncbi:4-carboxymuconolactone decarboxylase [Cohaesibacter marisflavi]|uniref:4-carboxymuconolactone decarboxylase n=1 Tax=Cohaesibacter marisflavi TaxID=655353 RepID=A0A1I5D364_9HYPH|nr:carboxymuconolactone decarboxylase family protein [Cohaesibacter marisflavi]SFN93660.1 4-carboxymuconolactone decarboxylase [Cohaesibacter marisflavi]
MQETQTQSPESNSQTSALERARTYCDAHHPGLEDNLNAWFGDMLPDFGESLVEWAYGRHYSRPGLDSKSRQLATVAALTVLGGQTAPQLKINIEHTLAVGASEKEIVEVIWQMAVYGGLPAAINGLNVAKEVFSAREQTKR